jgi:hypothetical protein
MLPSVCLVGCTQTMTPHRPLPPFTPHLDRHLLQGALHEHLVKGEADAQGPKLQGGLWAPCTWGGAAVIAVLHTHVHAKLMTDQHCAGRAGPRV